MISRGEVEDILSEEIRSSVYDSQAYHTLLRVLAQVLELEDRD